MIYIIYELWILVYLHVPIIVLLHITLVYTSYSEFWILNSIIWIFEFWVLTAVDSNSESWLVSRSYSCDQSFIIHDRCLEFSFCDCCCRSDRNDYYHKIVPFIRAVLSHIIVQWTFHLLFQHDLLLEMLWLP